MTTADLLAAGVATAVKVPGSSLPAPIVSLRHRMELRRTWWLLGWKREVRVEFFRLEQRYVYHGDGFALHVPVGFEFLASTPRAGYAIVSPLDLGGVAPLLHDFLYEHGGRPPLGTVAPYDRIFTRLEADRLFLLVMRLENVEEGKADAAYRAVRECGASSWRTS